MTGPFSEIRILIAEALARFPKPPAPSPKTEKEYQTRFERLLRQAGGQASVLNEIAARTSNTRTYFVNRAAIAFVCWTQLKLVECLLSSGTDIQAAKEAAARSASWYLDALASINPGCQIPSKQRKRRRSKRQSLRGLPTNWREIVPARLTPHHIEGFFVTALTGCRPSELKKGVKLDVVGTVIQATIEGAKVTADGGHKTRRLEWDTDQGNPFVDEVLKIMNGNVSVTIKGRNGFSRAITDAGKRLWPRHGSISAYSLRHAIASDLKALKWPPEKIAIFLGHAVTKTQSMYGASGQGGGGAVGLRAVSGSRPVKDNRRQPPVHRLKGPRIL